MADFLSRTEYIVINGPWLSGGSPTNPTEFTMNVRSWNKDRMFTGFVNRRYPTEEAMFEDMRRKHLYSDINFQGRELVTG